MDLRAAWLPGPGRSTLSSEPVVVVTIVGSTTPSVFLPTGAQRTVRLTPTVQALINRGFVTVTAREEIHP